MSSLGFRPPIAVCLAHPAAGVRQSMTDDLAATGIHVVGEAGDGQEALEQITSLVPDIALLAIDLPAIDGIELCTRLRDELPSCRVLLIAVDDSHPRVVDGIAAGAFGCHLTAAPAVPLVRAIRGTLRGESLPTPSWATRVLADYAALADGEHEQRAVPPPKLTPAEQDVLERLAAGESIAAIAQADDVTTHLVRMQAGFAVIRLHRALSDELLVARPSAPTPF